MFHKKRQKKIKTIAKNNKNKSKKKYNTKEKKEKHTALPHGLPTIEMIFLSDVNLEIDVG